MMEAQVTIPPAQPIVWVCINGILSLPEDSAAWTDRAVTWLNTRTAAKAEKWEYIAGPITRRLMQQSRAEKIARMLQFYQLAGFAVVLIGHSNGCDLIARILALRGKKNYFAAPVRAVHLVAPAADWPDFKRALEHEDVRRIHIYGSQNDEALKLAALSEKLFGWLGLGYGSLGLEGAIRAADDQIIAAREGRWQRVFDHSDDHMGHSTWWERGARFEATMQSIIGTEAAYINRIAA